MHDFNREKHTEEVAYGVELGLSKLASTFEHDVSEYSGENIKERIERFIKMYLSEKES